MKCRFCDATDLLPFIDLGEMPPSNALLSAAELDRAEPIYPLRVLVCPKCWLAQTEDFVLREALFSHDYHYSSSMSQTWLDHCERFVGTAIERFQLGPDSMVVEIASNDGYLLQYVRDAGIPCCGIEPTNRVAEIARAKGLTVIEGFFGRALAGDLIRNGKPADLIIANNVLAHVPDINDFVAGISLLIGEKGVVSFEFPHLLRLVEDVQFDTIYHEHYSYLSLSSVERILSAHGLAVFDIEPLTTHGGSLRVFACRESGPRGHEQSVQTMRIIESEAGIESQEFYQSLQKRADTIKRDLSAFLAEKSSIEEMIVGYGAAAKGNTLLNYAGVNTSHIRYIADRDPAKQGKFTPGGHIPIVTPDKLLADRPQWILILPWNLKDEIMTQLADARSWGAKFVTAIPELREA